MNWMDLLLVAIVLLSVVAGWRYGFISGALRLVSWVGSLAAGFLFYPYLAMLIGRATPVLSVWLQPVAFLAVVLLARLLLNLLSGTVLRHTPSEAHHHSVNKTLGLVPGFLNGLINAALVALLFLFLPFHNALSDTARQSRLADYFIPPATALQRALAPIFSEPLSTALHKRPATHESNEFVTLPYKTSRTRVRADLETEMLTLVNNERAKKGLRPVIADLALTNVARAHSNDMFAHGYFAHVNPDRADPFDRMRAAGIRFTTAGENLALAQTLQLAHDGLMNSPGHRANILQPRFGRLGIGIQDGGIYGLMISQEFRN